MEELKYRISEPKGLTLVEMEYLYRSLSKMKKDVVELLLEEPECTLHVEVKKIGHISIQHEFHFKLNGNRIDVKEVRYT